LIYLDSCLLIYVEEEDPRFHRPVLDAFAGRSGGEFCISAVVKAECLVGAYKRNDPFREAAYEHLFGRFRVLEIAEPTFLLAARLRANHGLKLPDALHLACAQENGCEALWTNDNRMAGAAPGLARNILG
jgi:predicted nucleic acid-binding protein